MRNVKQASINAFICALVILLFASSSAKGAPENKTAKKDTSVKPRWVNPNKNKIWSKVNIVQIPLTAIENHILGPVKSVRYIDYKISEEDGSKVLYDSGYNVYDKFGHLVDQNEYKADGTPKWKCIYKYDDKNKATRWDFKFENTTENSITTFKYDGKGNKIEENEVANDKKYSGRMVYKYDGKGNEIEETSYSTDGKVTGITTFKYDDKGYQIEWVSKKGDGQLTWKLTCRYDNNGNKIEGASYHSEMGPDYHWTEKNDNKGRLTERTTYKPGGGIKEITKYKYDDWDNTIESIAYNPDGSIDTAGWNSFTEFEYDNKGNAIKETRYKMKNGKKVMTEIAERKLEYY